MVDPVFYDFSKLCVIPVHRFARDYHGCYFDRERFVRRCVENGYQNPEWEIQQRIIDNEEGYFDFSKNMIDVGAYIGIYRWNLPFQKAWLFEPNRESFMLCCANAALNDRVKDTFIFNKLVSNGHEDVPFNGYDGLDHKEFQEYVADWEDELYYHKPEMMRTVMLDDYIDKFENIGFIKTDCEGMDWKVLEGAKEVIKKSGYPPILFENWPDYDDTNWMGPGYANHETPEEIELRNAKIREILEGMGYKINWAWVESHPDTHLAIKK